MSPNHQPDGEASHLPYSKSRDGEVRWLHHSCGVIYLSILSEACCIRVTGAYF